MIVYKFAEELSHSFPSTITSTTKTKFSVKKQPSVLVFIGSSQSSQGSRFGHSIVDSGQVNGKYLIARRSATSATPGSIIESEEWLAEQRAPNVWRGKCGFSK